MAQPLATESRTPDRSADSRDEDRTALVLGAGVDTTATAFEE
jgi:hypothetical protein